MRKTKLVELLKSFSKSEIKRFTNFVKFSYRTNKSKISKLLDEVVKYYPEFENENFTKSAIFKKIYPGLKYNDTAFRKLISYLTRQAEEFLIHQSLKKDGFSRDLYLLKELSFRNLGKIFEQCAAVAEKEMKKYPTNFNYYYNRFSYLNIVNSFHAMRKRSRAVENYQKEADSFFHYFFVEALNIYMYLVNEKKISNREFRLTLFNEVMNHLEKNSYSDIISIPVYYNCIKLILTDDEKYFRVLKEILKKLDIKIHNDELKTVYIVLENFCTAQTKKGNTAFKPQAFELQKESVSKGLHLSGERIHIFTFLNIVSNAADVGETVWAENFTRKNRHLLEPKYEFDAVNLCYAKCEFSRKEYEKALSRLAKINMEYSHFKLSVRTLMLMIYYELDLLDSAASMLDTYRHFIARDKLLPEDDKQNRLEFAKHFNEVVNLRLGMNKDINLIRTNILSTNNLVEKEWLLEKIDELNNN